MKKEYIPYLVILVIIAIAIVLYYTKPTPPPTVIYVQQTDSLKVWKNKVDSLAQLLFASELEYAEFEKKFNNQKTEHQKLLDQVKEMDPVGQVIYFGKQTGDSTILMRESDSIVLVPLESVKMANIKFKDLENCREVVEIKDKMLLSAHQMLDLQKEKEKVYIAELKYKDGIIDECESSKASLRSDLLKEGRKSERRGALNWGLGGVVVVLGMVLFL